MKVSLTTKGVRQTLDDMQLRALSVLALSMIAFAQPADVPVFEITPVASTV
jgi:hypothetical protein